MKTMAWLLLLLLMTVAVTTILDNQARTPYFIFVEEIRPEGQANHPGEGVASHAKVLGHLWSTISSQEKETYQMRIAKEREQVSKDLQSLCDAGIFETTTTTTVTSETD